MGEVPRTPLSAFLSWVEARDDLWILKATSIGLSVQQATDMKNAYLLANAAVNAQTIAKNAAKAATVDASTKVRELRTLVSANVGRIKAFAEASDAPADVYANANIDPPAPPSATPPPGTPFEPAVTLLPSGGLLLRWKCVNPGNVSGVIYEVQRRIGPPLAGNFAYIGASGVRSFEDVNLPAGFGGAANITYRVTASRSTQRGQPADFIVNVGTGGAGGGGGAFMSVIDAGPVGGVGEVKLAA
jgi:hypothetical protein